MSTLATPAPARPARAVMALETRLFLREPGTLFWTIAFPSALLVVLGLIPAFTSPEADLGGRRVIDLYVPVVALVAVVMGSVQALPVVLTGYRERGVLRRVSTTPARAGHVLGAQVVLHAATMTLAGLVAVLTGWLAFDVALPERPFVWAGGFVLATLAATAVGATIAALCPTTKVATAVGTAVFLPMLGSTGVWYPVQAMPGLLQSIVGATPLGAAVQVLDAAAVGDWPDPVHVLVTTGWVAVLGFVAVRFFRWE